MQMVARRQRVGDGSADVVATVGPLADAEAQTYASQLVRLVERHPDRSFAVSVTPVVSASGEAAEPPATPAELLDAVMSRGVGTDAGGHDLPAPDPPAR